jgi:hypothetical protein
MIDRIKGWLLQNPVWIFIAGICFVSDTMIHQQGEKSWSAYLWYIFLTSLIFSPQLLFIFCRKTLKQHLHKWAYRILWISCFLLYVPFWFVLGGDRLISNTYTGEHLLNAGWAVFLGIEVLMLLSDYLYQRSGRLWLKLRRFKLEHGVLVFIGCFASFFVFMSWASGAYYQQTNSLFGILGFALQMIAMLLAYYVFYLINHYFLVTHLLKKKGLIHYILGFFATLVLLYPVVAQLISFLPMVSNTQLHPLHTVSIFDEANFVIPFMGMVLSLPFIMVVQWYRQSNQLNLLSREKSEAELSMLRQQVNPHFFFNTLNNLYALSLRKDPSTPEVVLQLSDLMRYVIYRGKEGEVPLKEEVRYIEDYIHLQQLRLHKKLDYRFVKNMEDENLPVAPLMFITLVENAFKHGIEPAEGQSYLYLSLQSKGGHLTFVCENSVEEWEEKDRGIGLDNLSRRLDLIYPGQEVLFLEKGADFFRASLEISERI